MGARVGPGIRLRNLTALALGLALSGCVGPEDAFVHSVWRPANGKPGTSTVFYVTDREPDPYGPGGFGKHWSDRARCGTIAATVPAATLPGEPRENGTVKPLSTIECGVAPGEMDGVATAIVAAAQERHCRSVLLWIHGFNTLFDAAILRAGQLAGDTQSGCIAAAFSWSSEGDVPRYAADIEHSAYAVPMLESLLRALAATNLRIDIVSHSIGTRLVLQSLASLAVHADPPRENFVGEMILAAADVGVAPRNNDFIHLLHDATRFVHRTTVYASAGDAVLVISATAHGGVPRAGREPAGMRVFQTPAGERKDAGHIVDVVDATDAPAELLGHGYYAMSYEAVSDIALALDGVVVTDRLKRIDGWPATLICKSTHGRPCNSEMPHYALRVSAERRPSWLSRLVRGLVPLIPRVDFAPFTTAGE